MEIPLGYLIGETGKRRKLKMYAIVKTGGKQYKAEIGRFIFKLHCLVIDDLCK